MVSSCRRDFFGGLWVAVLPQVNKTASVIPSSFLQRCKIKQKPQCYTHNAVHTNAKQRALYDFERRKKDKCNTTTMLPLLSSSSSSSRTLHSVYDSISQLERASPPPPVRPTPAPKHADVDNKKHPQQRPALRPTQLPRTPDGDLPSPSQNKHKRRHVECSCPAGGCSHSKNHETTHTSVAQRLAALGETKYSRSSGTGASSP